MSLPVVSRKAGPSWLLGRRIPMRANLFLRSHTMVYTYCLLLLLAHRPDGSYYALWFLPRAAFWCLFAPPFAHARSQRGDTLGLSLGDPTIPTDLRLPICNAEPKRPWRNAMLVVFVVVNLFYNSPVASQIKLLFRPRQQRRRSVPLTTDSTVHAKSKLIPLGYRHRAQQRDRTRTKRYDRSLLRLLDTVSPV